MQAGWPIAVSPITITEHKHSHDLPWTDRPFDYFLNGANRWQLRMLDLYMESIDPDQLALSLDRPIPTELDFLPDPNDRALIEHAVQCGCERFWTVDYRTIWRYRERIAHFGVAVETPSEAWAAFRSS
jgi:hypothetical protein